MNSKSRKQQKKSYSFPRRWKLISIVLTTVRQEVYMIALLCLVLLADIVPFVIDLWEGKQ